jgi:hypothetical protein
MGQLPQAPQQKHPPQLLQKQQLEENNEIND